MKNVNGVAGSIKKILGVVLVCTSSLAGAQTVSEPGTQGGWGLRVGYGDDYQRIALAYETPTWWTHRLGGNWGRLDLVGELEAAYWRADENPDSLWQLSATPMFRWWASERFYLEAGIGVTGLSRTHFAGKTLSTAFQFGDNIGLGMLLGDAGRLGLRYSHYSNASIKRPNPGLNVLQLTYTYQF